MIKWAESEKRNMSNLVELLVEQAVLKHEADIEAQGKKGKTKGDR